MLTIHVINATPRTLRSWNYAPHYEAIVAEDGVPIARTRGDWYALAERLPGEVRSLTVAEHSLPLCELERTYGYAGGSLLLPDGRRVRLSGEITLA